LKTNVRFSATVDSEVFFTKKDAKFACFWQRNKQCSRITVYKMALSKQAHADVGNNLSNQDLQEKPIDLVNFLKQQKNVFEKSSSYNGTWHSSLFWPF